MKFPLTWVVCRVWHSPVILCFVPTFMQRVFSFWFHAQLFSGPSFIFVFLKDDRDTEIALSAVFRGVILWFPGESKLVSILLVSPLFIFFSLLSFETYMLKAQPHRKPNHSNRIITHTPLPKTVWKITEVAQFHSPKNFTALQWECTDWVGNPKMFHCLYLRDSICKGHINSSWGFGVRLFFPGVRGGRMLLLPSPQWTWQQQEFFFRLCLCWSHHAPKACWVLTRVKENSDSE